MADPLERLKILINSSTPIVVMETVEEMRAVGLVRSACAELNMAVFEWSIADGLVRSGSNTPVPQPVVRSESHASTAPSGNAEGDRLAKALSGTGSDPANSAK